MRVRFLENGVIFAVLMSSATQRSFEPEWPILVDVLFSFNSVYQCDDYERPQKTAMESFA
jgi:hypothetical protein